MVEKNRLNLSLKRVNRKKMEKSEDGSGWKKKIKVVESFSPDSYYKPGLKVHL